MTQEHGEPQNQGTTATILWALVGVLLLVGTGMVGVGVAQGVQASAWKGQAEDAAKKLNDPARKELLGKEAEQTRQLRVQQDTLRRLSVQQQAYAEKGRHLRLDTANQVLSLAEDGCVLRGIPVEIGDAVASEWVAFTQLAGWLPAIDVAWPSPGVHRLWGRVGRGIFFQQVTVELLEAPWPDQKPIPENLSAALVLEDGTRIYSEYAVPVLPAVRAGAIRAPHKELNAILSLLEETLVYVW